MGSQQMAKAKTTTTTIRVTRRLPLLYEKERKREEKKGLYCSAYR